MARTDTSGMIFIASTSPSRSASRPDHDRAGSQAEKVVGQRQRAEGGGADRGGSQVRHHGAGRTGDAGGEERAGRDQHQLEPARVLGEAQRQERQRQRGVDQRGRPLADRVGPGEPVGDDTAHDHADAHQEDEAGRGDAGLVRREAVGAVEVAGQPGEERTGDEQLQAAADVRADHRGSGDQGAQPGPLTGGGDRLGDRVAGVLVAEELRVVDEQEVEEHQHQADHGHHAEGPAPAEVDREDAAEEDAEDRAERAAGHERAGEGRALRRREHHQHDGQADAAVRGLAEPDEEPGEHHLLVVGRDGGAQRGEAPQGGHRDDGLGATPTVAQQGQRDREQADGQGHDAGECSELGVAQRPLDLEEGEDGREHLARHVVGQQQAEGQGEDDQREDPRPGVSGRRGGGSRLDGSLDGGGGHGCSNASGG